ncbi:serine/threonine-protein phosphatase rdgC isoform X2 [Atheta coriaria]
MGCASSKACRTLRCTKVSYEDDSVSSCTSSSCTSQVRNHRHGARDGKTPCTCTPFLASIFPTNFIRMLMKTPDVSMSKLEITMKAALLIQRWYRRYLARIEVRRRYTWTIFQSIEYAGEQDQVKLYNFFNALLTHIPDTTKPRVSSAGSKSSSIENLDMHFVDESDDQEEEDMEHVEKKYRGIHINFPMQKDDLDKLIEFFRRKKQQRLHAKYVAQILRDGIDRLKVQPNINVASTAISKQITVCGDLHGKLDDLLVIFHKNGLPSPENPYVFNGDFVDRGKKGLEVLLLLLASYIVFPGGVFLNRGNHEDHIMNSRYGFIKEVQMKYRHNSEKLLKLIDGVYRWLPLGTVVNNRVLIVHGGISDNTDLDLIKNVDRAKYSSLLRPPLHSDGSAPGAELIDKVEWKQLFDILWSDPQSNEGCIPNGLRGAGTYFGPDVSAKFLQRNKMLYLIRSHECKPEGYEVVHNNRVITIFSASNYYEVGSNKGAYLKLVGQNLDTHFIQYTSNVGKTKRLTFRQRVGLVEESAMRELRGHIVSNREALESKFAKSDPEKTGFISLSDWCRVMEDVTELTLPWRMLKTQLVVQDPDTQLVKYSSTFDKMMLQGQSNNGGNANNVVETLYRNRSSLEAIFRIIDKDNSGFITLEEFSDACNLIKEHMPNPITQDQLEDICRLMDMNKDGLVDLNEFLETFRMVDPMQRRMHDGYCENDDGGFGNDDAGQDGAGGKVDGEDARQRNGSATTALETPL